MNTGLEFPEVQEFVKRQENVEILKPKMNFRQVIEKYGYPFIGKEVAGCVYGARRYMEKLAAREMGLNSCSTIPNHSYMADLAGIGRRGNKQDALYQSLVRGEIPSTDIKTPVRCLILQGNTSIKKTGRKCRSIPGCTIRSGINFFWKRHLRFPNGAATS